MTENELVAAFFTEGYGNRDYEKVLQYVAENYIDHSPAGSRSNRDAVAILKIVAGEYPDMQIKMLDIFGESGMVATRVRYEGTHFGGKHICFEALENFLVENGKITESWGYWPDKQIEMLLQAP